MRAFLFVLQNFFSLATAIPDSMKSFSSVIIHALKPEIETKLQKKCATKEKYEKDKGGLHHRP